MQVEQSERLSYELMTIDDAELLYQLDQDVEVMRFINGGKISSMDDIQKISIPRMQSYTSQEKGWGLWKVTINQTEAFIGWVLVRPMGFFSKQPESDNLEIGWRFMQDSWGRGFATEAANSVINALIEQSKIKKLTAIAFEDNTASINIMRKVGMKYIETYTHKDPLGDNKVVYYQLQVAPKNQ